MIALFDASAFQFIHGGRPDYHRSLPNHIKSIMKATKASHYIGILDGKRKGTFRIEVSKTKEYKGNRDSGNLLDSFPYFFDVRNMLIEQFGFIVVEGIEADDMVGILQTRFTEQSDKSVIISTDKDLLQVPGLHYNLMKHKALDVKPEGEISLNAKRSKIIGNGEKLLMAQMLLGDRTDNIMGLPKCGPVCAYNTVNSGEGFTGILDAYNAHYGELGIEMFKETFKLVHILRHNDAIDTPTVIDYKH